MTDERPTWEVLHQRIGEVEAKHAELLAIVHAQAKALDLQQTMLKQLTLMAELQMTFMKSVKEIVLQ